MIPSRRWIENDMVRQSNRAFGFTFAAVMAVIWIIAYLMSGAILVWPMIIAAVAIVLAAALPSSLLPFNRLWVLVLGVIGHINNRITLGLFFCSIIIPIGILMRLLGKDPMNRTLTSGTNSYLTPVGRKADADTYRDMF